MVEATASEAEIEPRDQNALAIWLKDQRLAARLTQRDVVPAAEISSQMLSRIENGLTHPSYRIAARLAEVLDVTVTEMAAAYRAPSSGADRLVNVLVDAGMDCKDALAIQSRLTRPLRDALFEVLVERHGADVQAGPQHHP